MKSVFLAGALQVLAAWLVVSGSAQEAEAQPSGDCSAMGEVQEYWSYLIENLCELGKQNDCLEPTSYYALRSDGRRVLVEGVYRWRSDNAYWSGREHLLPHFIHEYMKKLRNAYEACPDDFFHGKLYDQVDYLMSQAVARGAGVGPLPALVWENRYSIAQGMEQAEMAAFLASVAYLYAQNGAREAAGTMRYAFQALEALYIPVGVANGGVVSVVQDLCGAKEARFRKGFWFHSRGVGVDTRADGGEDDIATVLNQHLHVICDILTFYRTVSRRPDLIPPEYGTVEQALARIEDRAIGGLYQLAFSRGNNSAAPQRPPSAAQFMRRVDSAGIPYYFSYYRFDLSDRRFHDISLANTCGYHTHSLKKMLDIKTVLDKNYGLFAKTPSNQGWRLFEAVDRLLSGTEELMGQIGSTSAMWQFYLAQQVKYTLEGCPVCKDADGNVIPCGDDDLTDLFPHFWRSTIVPGGSLGPPSFIHGGFMLSVTAMPGVTYRLRAASALPPTNWTDLASFVLRVPTTNLFDSNASNFKQRFYQVVSP